MANKGLHTFAEIMSQPLVWREALEAFQARAIGLRALWNETAFDEAIFTGCGSTYYLSLAGAALFQQLTGVSARAYPASELIFYPPYRTNKTYLLVTVSRSGTTSETIEAAHIFRERAAGKIIGVGCYGESPLMQSADLALVIDSARERSIAQTRSFSSMLVMVQLIAGYLGGQGDATLLATLPNGCERLLNDHHEFAQRLGEDQRLERFYFLGSHARYGVACEAMLKLKEMSLSHSEAFHPLEFRHGPMSMVNENTLIVGLLGESAYNHETAVLKEMAGRGARTLAIANTHTAGWANPISLRADVPEWGQPVLYLPVLQLMAYYRALANGQDPDHPTNLEAVVSLDNLR
jgi:glucosamine--fructose-6-phosphate aminotransferase (isomerizing)